MRRARVPQELPRGRPRAPSLGARRSGPAACGGGSGRERPVAELLLAADAFGFGSVTAAKKAVRRGEVFVDGARATVATRAPAGASLEWRRRQESGEPLPLADVPAHLVADTRVLFEDAHAAVLLKPAGVPSVASNGWHAERLAAHVCAATREVGALHRPRVCHRLDAPVSGVLAVAKTRPALEAISRAFARREASKTYVALVAGDLSGAPRVVDAPLPDKRTGRDLAAVTELEPLGAHASARHGAVTLVRLRPRTGYYHQLRRHLALLGHPILGDRAHGAESLAGGRIAFDALERELERAPAGDAGGLMLFAAELELPLASAPGGVLRARAELPSRFERRLELEACRARA